MTRSEIKCFANTGKQAGWHVLHGRAAREMPCCCRAGMHWHTDPGQNTMSDKQQQRLSQQTPDSMSPGIAPQPIYSQAVADSHLCHRQQN